jgi:hypothetical protein
VVTSRDEGRAAVGKLAQTVTTMIMMMTVMTTTISKRIRHASDPRLAWSHRPRSSRPWTATTMMTAAKKKNMYANGHHYVED